CIGAGCDAQQEVAKSSRCMDARRTICAATARADFTQALGAGQSHALDDGGIKTRLAFAPVQFRKVAADRVKPCWLTGIMTITPLLDTAGPAAVKISNDPSAFTGRIVQTEMRPRMGLLGMLDNAAPSTDSSESGGKAAPVIALHLADTSAFDPERLPGPQL